jgi:hypothetical protein
MSRLLRYIDKIAKENGGEILYFRCLKPDSESDAFQDNDHAMIEKVISFCSQHNIKFEKAGPSSNSGFLCGGPLYLVVFVPFDPENKKFKLLVNEYENPDGSMKYNNCTFCFTKFDQ